MAEIKNFPQPRVNSFVSRGGKTSLVGNNSKQFSTKNLPRTPIIDRPANNNPDAKRIARQIKRAAEDKARARAIQAQINASLNKGANTSMASKVAGGVARGALRAAGPVGALVGMTGPAGEGSERPIGRPRKGNVEQMLGGARVGPTQAPNRTAQSTASPPKGRSSYGGGGRDSGRSSYEGSGARSSGVASRPTSSGKSSYGGGGRDSGGVSKSAPARGTERFAKGSLVKSKVNQAGTYTKPGMRKKLFESVKASAVQGTRAGQWSARKAQLLAKKYKAAGGGYK
jgi:hypothetical protein